MVSSEPSLHDRVNAALDKIRPAIAADGSDVWLIDIHDGVARVQMIGACGGCAAVMQTLKGGIERIVCEDVPEIRAVEHI